MTLKMNRSVSYPTRDELLEFGRNVCHVPDPAAVVERIGDAMSATLANRGAGMPEDFLRTLREEWDAGRSSVAPVRFFTR
ncbi:hypothetical protein [Paraburkholderia phosphatilytica]|uniref:hypothetical protein n=1 Tax=Paraburkholderia phosphatilytica TaxID=2282883 RepID=UPI000F5EA06D|nr:hypothetical protein [Paraburkholderia phosphatilytica]